jgi:spore coat-associated protein N
MNKKLLICVLLIGVMAFGIGMGTFAYFTSQATSTDNVFETGELKIGLGSNAEGFVSGDNWQPGSSVTEDLVVSNDGTLDLKYRISAAMADGANAALYNELMVIISKGGQELYNGLLKDMTPILPGTIAVGGSDTLTFTVSLPDSGAPQNHLQGLNAGVIFTFDATQTNNADDAWVYQQ